VVADRPGVAEQVPPLAPWDGVDPRLALAAGVGADWADLGLADSDPELAAIAAEVAGLGWAPERQR